MRLRNVVITFQLDELIHVTEDEGNADRTLPFSLVIVRMINFWI